MTQIYQGSCLCGRVTYEVKGELRNVCYCHCTQCRKTSGHFVASTQCLLQDITINEESITWYRSSDTATRGFCRVCGSQMFWKPEGGERISIFAGSLDGNTSDIAVDSQICYDTKGDYYELPSVPCLGQESLKR